MSNAHVTLTFSVEAINVVLAGLGELPHKVSAPLIDSIRQAAASQLNPPVTSGEHPAAAAQTGEQPSQLDADAASALGQANAEDLAQANA